MFKAFLKHIFQPNTQGLFLSFTTGKVSTTSQMRVVFEKEFSELFKYFQYSLYLTKLKSTGTIFIVFDKNVQTEQA